MDQKILTQGVKDQKSLLNKINHNTTEPKNHYKKGPDDDVLR